MIYWYRLFASTSDVPWKLMVSPTNNDNDHNHDSHGHQLQFSNSGYLLVFVGPSTPTQQAHMGWFYNCPSSAGSFPLTFFTGHTRLRWQSTSSESALDAACLGESFDCVRGCLGFIPKEDAFGVEEWPEISEAYSRVVTNVVDTVGPAVVAIKHKDGRGQAASVSCVTSPEVMVSQ